MTAADVARLANARERKDGQYESGCPCCGQGSGRRVVITQADDGHVLIYARCGCRTEEVRAAWGLTWRDLFADTPTRPDPCVERERRAWEGLESWRQRRLTDNCALIRGLESLAAKVSDYMALQEADLNDTGRLTETQHAELLSMLELCYHELPGLEREWELLTSNSRNDHLVAWRQAKRRTDAIPA